MVIGPALRPRFARPPRGSRASFEIHPEYPGSFLHTVLEGKVLESRSSARYRSPNATNLRSVREPLGIISA